MSRLDDASIDAMARELPAPAPSPARLEQMRNEILAAAGSITPAPPRSLGTRGLVVSAAAALAVAAAVIWSWRDADPAGEGRARSRATIEVAEGAELARLGAPPDEVIQLRHGTITVEVSALAVGERFRVITGDAEVEVRGTRFVVAADRGRIRAVAVEAGVVELRLQTGTMLTLTAGQRWPAEEGVKTAAAPVAPPVPGPAVPAAPTSSPPARHRITAKEPVLARPSPVEPDAGPPAAPALPTAPGEAEFRAGWDAMKRGAPAKAAEAFAGSRRIAARGAIAEDAHYWEGVALARAGRPTAAASTLRGFLDAYPKSARAGEAAARLGWLLLDDGEVVDAERWFRAAADDPVPSVRQSARAGLDRLAPARSSSATPTAPTR